MSIALCGRHLSEEAKLKIGNYHRGKPLSENHKMKIGEGLRGNTNMLGKHLSDATKQKLREAFSGERNPNYRKHHSEATKKKMSESNRGQVPWILGKHHSAATKAKISAGNRGKFVSAETCERLRIAHLGQTPAFGMLGKHHSPETKLKMSEAHSGEKCHLWRGGISFAPYTTDFNRQLRRSIRDRDNYTCQLCGKKWKPGMYPFSVHHTDYNKQNSKRENLLTVCPECHTWTNHNRDFCLWMFRIGLRRAA